MSNIIYASKFYINSKYKDEIKSAIENPVNLELVQQLNEYVDSEDGDSFDMKFSDIQDDDLTDSEVDFSDIDDVSFGDDEEFLDDEEENISIDTENSDEFSEDNTLDTNDLRDEFNSDTDLSGVVRINDDDGELWIHYNDKTNLNNVMESVIEYMSENYNDYEFNRLARTENAIVFTYDVGDSLDIDNLESDIPQDETIDFGGDSFGEEEKK